MDSRLLQDGDLFLASFGGNHDARDFIDEALACDVVAIVAESGGEWQGISYRDGIAIVAVDNLRAKISEIAARFYRRPSSSLTVFGVTGTNGKTTCSQLLAQMLEKMGVQCGVIGTLGYGQRNALTESPLTTPDAVTTQKALAEMVAAGDAAAAVEVSSVGLHQRRVAAVEFDTAVFTNLSRDHLDYHGSMEAYAESKKKLFAAPGLRHAVINLDDPYALSIINDLASDVEIATYSRQSSIATVFARQVQLTPVGFKMQLQTPSGQTEVASSLLGSFNVSNVLAVLTTVLQFQSAHGEPDLLALGQLASSLQPVPGRMQLVGDAEDVTAVVDYAHTPDGLRSAMGALREHFSGNIWCVFGCGGNRDQGKRPLMGEIAERLAERVIITDDNPRNEDGDEIAQHILSGLSDRNNAVVIRDRARAIDFAIANAAVGDVVLVAGKGHETYQTVAGIDVIFSDVKQVRIALRSRQE